MRGLLDINDTLIQFSVVYCVSAAALFVASISFFTNKGLFQILHSATAPSVFVKDYTKDIENQFFSFLISSTENPALISSSITSFSLPSIMPPVIR